MFPVIVRRLSGGGERKKKKFPKRFWTWKTPVCCSAGPGAGARQAALALPGWPSAPQMHLARGLPRSPFSLPEETPHPPPPPRHSSQAGLSPRSPRRSVPSRRTPPNPGAAGRAPPAPPGEPPPAPQPSSRRHSRCHLRGCGAGRAGLRRAAPRRTRAAPGTSLCGSSAPPPAAHPSAQPPRHRAALTLLCHHTAQPRRTRLLYSVAN